MCKRVLLFCAVTLFFVLALFKEVVLILIHGLLIISSREGGGRGIRCVGGVGRRIRCIGRVRRGCGYVRSGRNRSHEEQGQQGTQDKEEEEEPDEREDAAETAKDQGQNPEVAERAKTCVFWLVCMIAHLDLLALVHGTVGNVRDKLDRSLLLSAEADGRLAQCRSGGVRVPIAVFGGGRARYPVAVRDGAGGGERAAQKVGRRLIGEEGGDEKGETDEEKV
jgi:hypothetical protein